MVDQLAQAFGKQLKTYRKRAHLTQEALALETDLDRTYISLLERGLRQPSITTVFLLAKALGIKPTSIIGKLERRYKW